MASKAPTKDTKTAPVPAKSTTPATTPAAKKPVPETILKKKRSKDFLLAAQIRRRLVHKWKKTAKRQVIVQKAEKYAREYRSMERSLIRMRRLAKGAGSYYLEPEAKVAFVVRIRGIRGLAPKPKKVLRLLRLRQIHNGTFLRLNKASINMLKLVEPYVTFGYANQKTVHDLIYKRGFGKVGGQRHGISNNTMVEKALGQYGIVCIEDIVHEIVTCGPHFKEVNSFLWPFKLSSPRGGFKNVKTHYNEGGDAGNREHQINDLARRML